MGKEEKRKYAAVGYCVKCKHKRGMVKVESVIMKNGRPAKKGKCHKCGCGMYRIGSGKNKKG